jgi:hypothetical protein
MSLKMPPFRPRAKPQLPFLGSIDLLGLVHGTADGSLAIGALVLVAIVALAIVWLRPSQARR